VISVQLSVFSDQLSVPGKSFAERILPTKSVISYIQHGQIAILL